MNITSTKDTGMRINSLAGKFIALTLLLALSGCSMFGSGKKSGQDGGLSEADLNAQREARFAEGGLPTAEGGGIFRDVHFDYDSSQINDLGRQDIEYNAQKLNQTPDLKIQLEGHCDERGTAEYNLSLGAERARAVKDALMSFGVPTSRMDTISYGEEVPLVPGNNESAWAQNRRVHFSPFSENAGKY